jgi:hypothetical protein
MSQALISPPPLFLLDPIPWGPGGGLSSGAHGGGGGLSSSPLLILSPWGQARLHIVGSELRDHIWWAPCHVSLSSACTHGVGLGFAWLGPVPSYPRVCGRYPCESLYS